MTGGGVWGIALGMVEGIDFTGEYWVAAVSQLGIYMSSAFPFSGFELFPFGEFGGLIISLPLAIFSRIS